MAKDIEEKRRSEAVDKFLKDIYEKGSSDVVCPICKKTLIQTENCLIETFRGI